MKPWQIACAVLLVAGCAFGLWKIGELQGVASTNATCNIELKRKDDAVAADKLAAVNAARVAQKKLDDQALAEANNQVKVLSAAVAAAKEEAAKTEATNKKLSADYARLKANDADIQKWGSSCLPAGILGSLHGPAYEAGKQCTR